MYVLGKDDNMIGVFLGYICYLLLMIFGILDILFRYSMIYLVFKLVIRDDIYSRLEDKERE